MFERFTERARQAVVLAQDEARELGHSHVGTEHLLLGLLCEQEGLGARVLKSFGVETATVRAQIARTVRHGDAPPTGQIPFTPHAKRVLELGLREALARNHGYIGTEHLLLGLSREPGGLATNILAGEGVDRERIRDAVDAVIGPGRPVGMPRLVRFSVSVPLALAFVLGAGIAIGWAIWG